MLPIVVAAGSHRCSARHLAAVLRGNNKKVSEPWRSAAPVAVPSRSLSRVGLRTTPREAPERERTRMTMSTRGGGCCFAASAAVSVPELRPEEGLAILTNDIDTVILDCDGVLWCGNEVLPHTAEALQVIRKLGKRLLFLTNNATKSRKAYQQKFASLGIECAPEEIVPASYCAAAYLESIDFPKDKKIFLVSSGGVQEELREAGFSYVGGETDFAPSVISAEDLSAVKVNSDIGAVVVGFDWNFSYDKLAYASMCLREIPGCRFVLTNGDHGDHVGAGRIMPVTGSISASIELASGQKPVIVGKGGPWLLPWLCQHYGLNDASRACIVGDRLDTDIALGREGGLRTFLPLTGVTTLEDIVNVNSAAAPDYYMDCLATLTGIHTK